MNRQEFLAALRSGLSGLPQEDVQRTLDFYGEMVDDYMEDGMSEGEAVAAVGPVRDIVAQILAETPLPKLVRAKVKPKHPLKAWEIVLLVLGSPLWVPLLLAGGLLVLSCYAVLWSVIVSLYAVDLSFLLGALAGGISFLQSVSTGDVVPGLFLLGLGLVSFGIFILLFFLFRTITSWILRWSRQAWRWMKFRFVRKEEHL